MGGFISSRKQFTEEEVSMALAKAKNTIASNPVVVYSKSYCPYCVRAKNLLKELKAKFLAIELDHENLTDRLKQNIGDGAETQAALLEITGQRTVPNIFIGGKHIGGCDDLMATNRANKLVSLLTEAGALNLQIIMAVSFLVNPQNITSYVCSIKAKSNRVSASKYEGFSFKPVSSSCKTCRGKGAIECPGCKGTGKNKKNGNIFERWKCFDCQGFGMKGCPNCGKGGLTPEQRGER